VFLGGQGAMAARFPINASHIKRISYTGWQHRTLTIASANYHIVKFYACAIFPAMSVAHCKPCDTITGGSH
jgi:hypothetical protein